MTDPTLEELQDSINELSDYKARLERDVKAIGSKLRMPQKKIDAAVKDNAELQRINEILDQLTRQRNALSSNK